MKLKFISAVMSAAMLAGSFGTYVSAEKIGVNTHAGHAYVVKPNIDAACEMGADIIRDSYGWSGVEKEMGKYEIPYQSNGDFVESAYQSGKKVIFVIGYENSLYTSEEGKIMPSKDDMTYFNAYLDYLKFIVNHYKGKVYAYEIWNEPDLLEFNPKYCKNPEVYFDLLKASYEVIKDIDPDALVIGGSIAVHYDFYLDGLLKAGGGDYMDAVSVHTYHQADKGPEANFRTTMDGVEAILDKYSFTKPLWLTENGWYTGDLETAVTEEEQAAYLIRTAALWEDFLKDNQRDGEYVWYDLRDDESYRVPHDKKWGLTDINYNPKKAFYSAKLYNKVTGDKKFENLTVDGTNYIAEFSNSENHSKTYIVWNSEGTDSVKINTAFDNVTYYDYQGNVTEGAASSTETTITTGINPVVIEGISGIAKLNPLELNEQKSVIKVSGTIHDTGFVNVELWLEGQMVNFSEVAVSEDGSFECYFNAGQSGHYVVKAGNDEHGDSKTLEIESNQLPEQIISGVAVTFDKSSMTAVVSGSISGMTHGETAAIAVVPADIEISKLIPKDFVFLDEVDVTNGVFTKQIPIRKDASGEYTVLINSRRAANVNSSAMFTVGSAFAKVASFSVSQSDEGKITASANILNKNSEDKQATIVISRYDSQGRFINVKITDINVPANQTEAVLYKAEDTMSSDTASFKAFIWDSMGGMHPLYESQ